MKIYTIIVFRIVGYKLSVAVKSVTDVPAEQNTMVILVKTYKFIHFFGFSAKKSAGVVKTTRLVLGGNLGDKTMQIADEVYIYLGFDRKKVVYQGQNCYLRVQEENFRSFRSLKKAETNEQNIVGW